MHETMLVSLERTLDEHIFISKLRDLIFRELEGIEVVLAAANNVPALHRSGRHFAQLNVESAIVR